MTDEQVEGLTELARQIFEWRDEHAEILAMHVRTLHSWKEKAEGEAVAYRGDWPPMTQPPPKAPPRPAPPGNVIRKIFIISARQIEMRRTPCDWEILYEDLWRCRWVGPWRVMPEEIRKAVQQYHNSETEPS